MEINGNKCNQNGYQNWTEILINVTKIETKWDQMEQNGGQMGPKWGLK